MKKILNVDMFTSTTIFVVLSHKDSRRIVVVNSQWPRNRIHNSKLRYETLIHTPCEVASKQKTNFASIVEVVVKVCLVLHHDTATPAIIKIYSDVDLRELTQPAKSESEYPITSRLFVRLNISM